MNSFRGFQHEAVQFFRTLEGNNNRHWWLANKDIYIAQVQQPMEALLAELGPQYGRVKIFRPQRDTRFSADKTPYKTHQGAYAASPEGFAWYVHLDGDGLRVGGGAWMLTSAQLARFRQSVDDEDTGVALQKLLATLHASQFEIGGDLVRTRPRGVSADHPRLQLMRHRTLHASRHEGNPPWLGTPEARSVIASHWETLRPLITWFDSNVGAPQSVPV